MVRKQIEKLLSDAIKKLGIDGQASVSFSSLPELCDYQSNSAFVLAKQSSQNPYELANNIVQALEKTEFFTFEVARPAFINIKLTQKGYNHFANLLFQDE